jgi:hypothetical protein
MFSGAGWVGFWECGKDNELTQRDASLDPSIGKKVSAGMCGGCSAEPKMTSSLGSETPIGLAGAKADHSGMVIRGAE